MFLVYKQFVPQKGLEHFGSPVCENIHLSISVQTNTWSKVLRTLFEAHIVCPKHLIFDINDRKLFFYLNLKYWIFSPINVIFLVKNLSQTKIFGINDKILFSYLVLPKRTSLFVCDLLSVKEIYWIIMGS